MWTTNYVKFNENIWTFLKMRYDFQLSCIVQLLCLTLFSYLQEDKGIYNAKVKTMIEDKKIRITVNVNDLRAKNPKRAAA